MPLAAGRFEAFTGEHFALLGLFAVGAVFVVVLGRRRREPGASGATRGVLALALACAALPNQVYVLWPGNFEAAGSLPLELCDLAWMTAIWALLTRGTLPTALTYYWGLTLTVQGILTPSLGHGFGDPEYFVFWAKHLLVVWSALLLTLGLGRGPRWRDYWMCVAISLAWAVSVYAVDVAFDANYGYLVRKPDSASLLDVFGPWPAYLVVSLGILIALWAAITWPWVGSVGRRGDTLHA